MEYGRETLSSYEVKRAGSGVGNYGGSSGGAGKLEEVTKPTLLETSYQQPHLKLVELVEILGNTGWLKVLRLDDYAARKPRRLQAL